ncbi:UNVERIFIED_CONTAM: hypothetical protein Cloal_1079 [Acetivibrio alkalicellulosi]
MLKRVICLLLLVILTISLCVNGYAKFEDDLFSSKETKDTEQFLVRITRPEGDESTFRKSYIVCGNSDKNNITVKLFMYDEKTEKYEPFENTDGESSWQIGLSGFFFKEIELPDVGANRIRIVAYKNDEIEKAKDESLKGVVLGENAQVNTFTVTLLDKGVKDAMRGGFFRINDMLNRMFGS